MTTWFLPDQTIGLYEGGTSSTPVPLDSIFESVYNDVLGDNLTAPEITVTDDEAVEIDITPVPADLDQPTFDDHLFARSAYEQTHPSNVPLRERWTPLAKILRKAAPSEVVTVHLDEGGSVSVPPSQEIPEVTEGGILERHVEARHLSPGDIVPLQKSIHPTNVGTELLSDVSVRPYPEYRDQNLDDSRGQYVYGATLYTDVVSVNGIFLRS